MSIEIKENRKFTLIVGENELELSYDDVKSLCEQLFKLVPNEFYFPKGTVPWTIKYDNTGTVKSTPVGMF